ncbi:MAG: GNAT family N-acetyltransferase [Flavobacteriaceae bacterium]
MNAPAHRIAASPSFDVAIEDLAAAPTLEAEWRRLAASASEPNVFYDPDFLVPAAHSFAGRSAVRLFTIRHDRRLVFLLPFQQERVGPLSIARAFVHPYATTTAPLVDHDAVTQVVSHWLSAEMPGACGWRLPAWPAQGCLNAAVEAHLAAAAIPHRVVSAHERALLAPREPDRLYLETALSRKALKELKRQGRRFVEAGAGTRERLRGADAAEGFEMFMALEAAGWKGKAGTAMAANRRVAAFGRAAVAALAARDQVAVDVISAGEAPLAVTVTLESGGAAWLWKVAYDEAWAKYSPAVQLIAGMTHSLAESRPGLKVDSCAIPDHPMIDRLWTERLPIADLMIAAPGRSAAFAAAQSLARAEHHARRMAKTLLRR